MTNQRIAPTARYGSVFDGTTLYTHHDIPLPAAPLAVAWLGHPYQGGAENHVQHGSFAAVGTMDPQIEVWDLEVTDPLEPQAALGVAGSGHSDAVLALAASMHCPHLLASASADTSIKLWDVGVCQIASSYTGAARGTAVAFSPTEPSILASGDGDGAIRLIPLHGHCT